jgi:hypothetical protein
MKYTYTITNAIVLDHFIHCEGKVAAVLENAFHIAF